MNRHIAAWTIVAVAAFGLTACSGTPAAPEVAASPSVSAPVEQPSPTAEETTASGQTLAEACIEPSAKLVEASAQLMEANAALAKAGSKGDAKATIKAFTAAVDTIGAMADSATHPEVKAELTALHEGYGKLRDLLSKVLIDEDLSAAGEFATVASELQTSLTAFQALCAA